MSISKDDVPRHFTSVSSTVLSIPSCRQESERQSQEASAQKLVQYTESVVDGDDIQSLGINKHRLWAVVRESDAQIRTCIEFPVILLYFTLFAGICQIHYRTGDVHLQESVLRSSLTNDAKEHTDWGDIIDWIGNTAVPALVYSQSASNVNFPSGNKLTLVAGVSFGIVRSPFVPCADVLHSLGGALYKSATRCYPETAGGTVEDEAYNGWTERNLQEATGRFNHTLNARHWQHPQWGPWWWPLSRSQGRSHELVKTAHTLLNSSSGRQLDTVNAHMKDSTPSLWSAARWYQVVIPISAGDDMVQNMVASFKDVVDEEVVVASFHFLIRGKGETSGIVSSVYITWLFSRGGSVYTEVMITSTVVRIQPVVIGYLVCWAILLFLMSVRASMRLFAAVKHGDCCVELLQLDRLSEWILLVTGWLILLFVTFEGQGTVLFNQQWEEYEDIRKVTNPIVMTDFDVSWFQKINLNMRSVETWGGFAQYTVAFYHIFIVFQLLIASRGHLRLATVFNTLSRSFVDLIHLFVVLGMIFMAFVMMGHVLFGRRIPEFATVKGSLGYCTQVLLQRQYDETELTEEDALTATLWIWTFLLFLVIVIVNIVLAMIFDSYTEVQSSITAQDTIWNTTVNLCRHLKSMSSWISSHDLERALNKISEETVTASEFCGVCPNITDAQLQHLFQTAKLRLVTSVLRLQKNTLTEALASILLDVENLRSGIGLMMPTSRNVRTSFWDSDDQAVLAEAAELREGGPPVQAPCWVENGLLSHLRRRQAAMDMLYLTLVQLTDQMDQLGIRASGTLIPLSEPEPPARDGSRQLDPTLTGQHMRPMLTPGQGRDSPMARLPRPTECPQGISVLERLRYPAGIIRSSV